MVRAGELPQRRTLLRAYLTEIREGLISDIAGSEPELTTAQRVLVDRAISLLSVLRCIEEHVRETGVFKGKELAPVLLKSYCTYSAELRRTLEMLGIKGKAADRAMTPLEIAAVVDAEKVEKAGQAGPGLAQAGRSAADAGDDIGGKGADPGDSGRADEERGHVLEFEPIYREEAKGRMLAGKKTPGINDTEGPGRSRVFMARDSRIDREGRARGGEAKDQGEVKGVAGASDAD